MAIDPKVLKKRSMDVMILKHYNKFLQLISKVPVDRFPLPSYGIVHNI